VKLTAGCFENGLKTAGSDTWTQQQERLHKIGVRLTTTLKYREQSERFGTEP